MPEISLDTPEDSWLDHADNRTQRAQSTRDIWRESLAFPLRWIKKFFRFLGTTPGKMTSFVVVSSIAVLIAGLLMSQASAQRRADLGVLISSTEPVSAMSHDLYTALSLADTQATVGFVRSGADSEQNRQQYYAAYQQATRAAIRTAAGLSEADPETMNKVVRINELLPTYAGLVETAWANNRQGNPVGAAYMSEANALMRKEILPTADQLYAITSRQVVEQQRNLAVPLWVPLSVLFIALLILVAVQVWLAKATHRRLNRGFLFATILMVSATLWVSTANILTWQAGNQAYEQAAVPLNQLVSARVMAQQARTNETIALVHRQSQISSTVTFSSAHHAVSKALDTFDASQVAKDSTHTDTARDTLAQWQQAHDSLLEALSVGDYDTALPLAVGDSTSEGNESFKKLDTELEVLIDDARQSMRAHIARGVSASSFISIVVLVLSILSVLALWLGIRARLLEYL
ncbi:phenol hydroxylase [Corynebacterium sp. sy017]|uniref:phenol hydroxylase n=1 Tax=unclassified Corynebacterium TaxID=2624378 RepID=UPI001185AD76|nr:MULTISPECIES: phenol hydroxylase [unclassified Corynebacterium]MBP3088443.1 phenol hydroxylase [Corynebacterium sp. sy017]TSD91752.1 phenol hydroxylase [Corynebacterium sp. SY003]